MQHELRIKQGDNQEEKYVESLKVAQVQGRKKKQIWIPTLKGRRKVKNCGASPTSLIEEEFNLNK